MDKLFSNIHIFLKEAHGWDTVIKLRDKCYDLHGNYYILIKIPGNKESLEMAFKTLIGFKRAFNKLIRKDKLYVSSKKNGTNL